MGRYILWVVMLSVVIMAAFIIGHVSAQRSGKGETSGASGRTNVSEDVLLTLVNGDHPMPEDWQYELVELNNGQSIDSRAYPDLQEMMDDARAEGLEPYICSSWRSYETQEQLFKDEAANYVKQGFSKSEAEIQAAGGWLSWEQVSMNLAWRWTSCLWKISGWKRRRRIRRHSGG